MARMNEVEREALRISADAATKLLQKLQEQKAQLDDRISKMQAVVDAWESISGKRSKVDPVKDTEENTISIRLRVPKGQVPEHIDEILKDGGGYDEPELRRAIAQKFNVTYKRATVYTCLRRGLKDHKYTLNDKKWSLNPMRTSITA